METENSCLYKARVAHHRLSPRKHAFYYDIFMFYLDLQEIDALAAKLKLMSRNKFNIFNFRDKDHLEAIEGGNSNIRTSLVQYLMTQGVLIGNGKIMILTNLCTMGYQFNPVSFYFCYDEMGKPLCAVAEVGNTFLEMKTYFLGPKTLFNEIFHLNTPKEFYVSPFIQLDSRFDFNLEIPGEKLNIRIDDFDQNGKLFFLSSLKGTRSELNDRNLLFYFLSFPFITLKIIILIHWQAFLLWCKKISFIRKADNPLLQKNVLRPYKS